MLKKIILSTMICLAFIGCQQAFADQPNKGVMRKITLTSAGTEYSYTFPVYMYAFDIRSRTAGDFKVATVSGESGTNYFTVKSGEIYSQENLLIGNPIGDRQAVTLYFQSDNAGQIIEIWFWQSR